MASLSTAPALVERTEIHKSCKSIEALLSVLNEYCEAAGAVISLQKKLAKALKDAASTKATAEIPSVFSSLLTFVYAHRIVTYNSECHAGQREYIRVPLRR